MSSVLAQDLVDTQPCLKVIQRRVPKYQSVSFYTKQLKINGIFIHISPSHDHTIFLRSCTAFIRIHAFFSLFSDLEELTTSVQSVVRFNDGIKDLRKKNKDKNKSPSHNTRTYLDFFKILYLYCISQKITHDRFLS